jgi:hypothetical protein
MGRIGQPFRGAGERDDYHAYQCGEGVEAEPTAPSRIFALPAFIQRAIAIVEAK